MPELQYILVEYSTEEQEFLKNLNTKEEENSEFNFLEVTKIPTAQNGLELISQEWFKSIIQNHKDLLGISLRINDKVDENFKQQPHFFEFKFREFFIISFQSSSGDCESMTYWKIPNRERFYSTFIDDDKDEIVLQFLHEYLLEHLLDGCSGVMSAFRNKDEIRLHEIGTDQNSNLLMIAALWIRFEAVQQLITREFDIDYENIYGDMAIDIAWSRFIEIEEENKEQVDNIMMCLLHVNSVFPKNFDYKVASPRTKEFVDMCENLHRYVKNDDFDSLELKLKENSNLMYFYNRRNKSVLVYALENKKFKIIDYLETGINAGAHEELNFLLNYKKDFKKELENLNDQHKINALELPKTYLLVLRSKTKIGNNDQLLHHRQRNVAEAYDALDSNYFCSLLLQVAAQIKSVKIYFDFKHDNIFYLNPLKSITTLGATYPNGIMYIGAKQLSDDSTKHIVLATLAHEMCHLAVFVTYMNPNFDPFQMGDSEDKTVYMNEVMKECREKQELEPIVKNAFQYAEHLQPSELIVTVAEMFMNYHNNQEKIGMIQDTFVKLFKYVKVVKIELEKALPVLRKLEDPEINIIFDSLTDPMKRSIFHLPINLQGVETTFYDLIGYEESQLKLLKADSIRDRLLRGKGMEINQMCTLNLKYSMIQRNLIDQEKYQKLKSSHIQKYDLSVQEKSKSIMEIREDLKQSRFFILADYAGTGKTTVFIDSAIKIKAKETNFWVSYINLRKFESVFKNYEKKLKSLSSSDVDEILLQIIKIHDKDFEKAIFKNLLKRNQVVLLFDGVDEICPKHTEILMKTFAILKECAGTNEIWISTRPHYAPKIMKIFGVSPITFVLYTQEQKVEFIKDILTKNEITDEVELENAIGQINAFIFHLNWEPGFFSDPDHPLIIEIITEIYVEKREIKLDASSHYALYAAMIDKQKEKVGEKIPIVEHDPFSRLSVWQAHQVLAILVIIGELYDMSFQCILKDGSYYNDNFHFTLEELSIIKDWRLERKNGKWTSDMIQRYGFVTVNLDNVTEDRSCIDFSHRTYAEFFVAKFLIDFLFNNNFDQEEMEKMMHILKIVQGTPTLENVGKFIFSYMRTEAKKDNLKFHRDIKRYFTERIEKAVEELDQEPLKDGADPFIFFGKLVVCDDELTTKLWGLNDEGNSLEKIILSGQLKNLQLIIDTANFTLGENWHERLNKSKTKLIPNEQVEAMRDNIVESWDDWRKDKELLKFCDYLHKNFDPNVQRTIHDKNIDVLSNNKVRIEIIKIMSDIYDKETFVDKCLKQMHFPYFDCECLEFIFKEIERLYEEDRLMVRRILFVDLRGEFSPLYKAITSRNLEILPVVQKYYLKYQDLFNDIQDILLEIETSEIFKSAVESKIYPEFKTFIEDIFGNDLKILKEKIEDYLDGGHEAASDDTIKNIEDFIYFLFSDGEDKSKANDLLENVGIKEPLENYGFGYCDESYDDNGWENNNDDYDDNDYTGDNVIDIIVKKSKILTKLAFEGDIVDCLFPASCDEAELE